MRITGGEAKGRNLAALKGLDIRPSSDRVREAIFNLVGQGVRGKVLDLFAGTGALGIEALSRGANEAVFVDVSDQALRIIKKNLMLCGYEERGKVYKRDLSRGLPLRSPWVEKKFDLVFLDPPYGKGLIPPVLKALVERCILASPAVLVAEARKEEVLPFSWRDLQVVDIRTYGETKIQLYEYEV